MKSAADFVNEGHGKVTWPVWLIYFAGASKLQ